MDHSEFLDWEMNISRSVDFKTAYVDVAGDLNAGLLLSQILYWHLPARDGTGTKLRVRKDRQLWLAKPNSGWYEEVRLTEDQSRRAVAILEERGIIERRIWRFNGTPTSHIRIIWDRFLDLLASHLESDEPATDESPDPPGLSPNGLGKPEAPIRAGSPSSSGLQTKSLTQSTREPGCENTSEYDESREGSSIEPEPSRVEQILQDEGVAWSLIEARGAQLTEEEARAIALLVKTYKPDDPGAYAATLVREYTDPPD